jgi:hypothetical protein
VPMKRLVLSYVIVILSGVAAKDLLVVDLEILQSLRSFRMTVVGPPGD